MLCNRLEAVKDKHPDQDHGDTVGDVERLHNPTSTTSPERTEETATEPFTVRPGAGIVWAVPRKANDAKVVAWVPMPTKEWLEKEAARRGLATSAYLRSIVVQMQQRAAA